MYGMSMSLMCVDRHKGGETKYKESKLKIEFSDRNALNMYLFNTNVEKKLPLILKHATNALQYKM